MPMLLMWRKKGLLVVLHLITQMHIQLMASQEIFTLALPVVRKRNNLVPSLHNLLMYG